MGRKTTVFLANEGGTCEECGSTDIVLDMFNPYKVRIDVGNHYEWRKCSRYTCQVCGRPNLWLFDREESLEIEPLQVIEV